MTAPIFDCVLFVLGAFVGADVNWAIYRLAIIHPRNTSPWSRIGSPEVRWYDYVPIAGWYFQRRDAAQRGRGFWIRPMIIELACAVALPLLFRSIQSGMLTSGASFELPPSSPQDGVWTAFYFALIALLVAATFIDFDEKTIPDEITLPGTIVALACAYLFPITRLPDINDQPTLQFGSLQFASPAELPQWHNGPWGLIAVLGLCVIWMFALLPKTITWRYGWRRGLRYLTASMIRKPRVDRATDKRLHPLNIVTPTTVGLLAIALMVASAAAWSWGGSRWDHFMGAWLGLGFGGGLVWAVRVIAGNALGKEAMGFGDVTLMAMIGAWMGWQPALLVFAIAPFAALAIAAFQLIVIRHTEIAFGPYLSLGAVVVLVYWGTLWHDWAKHGVFALGPILLAVIFVCLILMAGMLSGWRAIQTRWTGDRE